MILLKRHLSIVRFVLLLTFALVIGNSVAANDSDTIIEFQRAYQKVNSLKHELITHTLTDKQKMELYAEIGHQYSGMELDSSTAYYHKAAVLAQRLKAYDIWMNCYASMGINHSFQGNYEEAFACYEQSKALAITHGNKLIEALSLSSIGFTYAKQGKHNTAIEYYLQYLKLSESEGWTENCVRAFANLGEINRRISNTEMALYYLKQGEEVCRLLPVGRYQWWMPQIYNEYAVNYLNKGDYDEALRYALKADSVNVSFGTVNRSYTKSLLASIYLYLHDFETALMYVEESFREADILKDISLYINAGLVLSDVYLAQKRYPEAEAEAFKAWQIDTINLDESRALVKNMAMANIYMGNIDKAAYYLQKYSELNASYAEKSFQNTVSDMTIRYETEKKEEQIITLVREHQLYVWLILSGGLLLVALAVMLALTVRYARKQRQLIVAEALQKGELGERMRIAQDLHDRLGGSLSAVKLGLINEENLQIISAKLDSCIKELREITNNIMPRSLQMYGMKGALEDFCVDYANVHFHFFGQTGRIHHNQEYAVFCCAKELVNNALKHADASAINLQLVQSKKYVTLTVQDDGCGFDDKTVKKGNGLANIRNRVASCKGRFDVASAPGKGTEAVVEIMVNG